MRANERFGNPYYKSISHRLGGGIWTILNMNGNPIRTAMRQSIVPEDGYTIGQECAEPYVGAEVTCTEYRTSEPQSYEKCW